MTQHLLDIRLAQLARRRTVARVVRALAPRLALSLALGSALVVTARLALPEVSAWLWAVPALAVALPFVAWPRGAPSRTHLAADLDLLVHGDGLVMALASQAPADRDPAWSERLLRALEGVVLPAVSWRPVGAALASGAALAAAFAIPQVVPEPVPEPPPVRVFFDEARERLGALAAADLLAPETRAELEQQLERLEAEARETGMTQAAWDGLDRVGEEARGSASLATRRLAEALAAAEQARGLSVAAAEPETPELVDPDEPEPTTPEEKSRLKKKPKPEEPGEPGAAPSRAERSRRLLERLTRESDRKALKRFAQSLGDLAQVAPGLVPRLDDAMLDELERLLEQLGPDAGLTPEQMEALRRAAGGGSGDPGGQGGQGGGAEPMTQEDLERLVEALRRSLEGEAQSLEGTEAGRRLQVLLAGLRAMGTPGGPGRGGGPAPLTRDGRPSGPAGDVTALPPGLPEAGDGSVTLATEARAPELDDAARRELVRAAAQAFDPTRADARRARVAPRHKAAVGRYFGEAPAPGAAPQDPP